MNKVILKNLPTDTKGFSRKNEDDSVTIVLNARYSYETNVATYCHEVSHIDDYEKCDVDKIENLRHK
jgi:hypothetical protein